MASFLSELNSEIINTHKSLNDLNESLSITLQDSKKWTILSRFLSGTGLWSIQNRLRAVVSVFAEYQKAQIQTMENDKKTMDLLGSLTKRKQTLMTAQDSLNKAKSIDLGLQEKHLRTHELKIEQLEEEIRAGRALTTLQQSDLKHAKQRKKDINEFIEGSRKANEELKGIKEFYQLTGPGAEQKAQTIMQARLNTMKDASREQDKLLTGGKEGKRLAGKMEFKEAERKIALRAAGHEEGGVMDKLSKMQMLADKEMIWLGLKLKATKLLTRFAALSKALLKTIAVAAIYALLVIGVIGVISALIIKYWGIIEPFLLQSWSQLQKDLQIVLGLLYIAWDFFGDAWDDLRSGDAFGFLINMALGIGSILVSLIIVAWSLLITATWALIGVLWGLLSGMITNMFSSTEGFFGGVIKILGAMLFIAGLFIGWPLVLAGLIVMAIPKMIKKLVGKKAAGGTIAKDMTLVGEKGPELVSLPKGSRVYSNQESKRMASGVGGTTNNINVHVNGRLGASDQEIRDIARKVGAQINRGINRSTTSGTRV